MVKQFYLTHEYQILPFQAEVDLGAMVMKGYSSFSKAPAFCQTLLPVNLRSKFQWKNFIMFGFFV